MEEGKFGETRSRGKIKKMSSTDINNDAEVHLTYPRVIQFAKDRRVVLTCELKETLLVHEIAFWKRITQLNLLKNKKTSPIFNDCSNRLHKYYITNQTHGKNTLFRVDFLINFQWTYQKLSTYVWSFIKIWQYVLLLTRLWSENKMMPKKWRLYFWYINTCFLFNEIC